MQSRCSAFKIFSDRYRQPAFVLHRTADSCGREFRLPPVLHHTGGVLGEGFVKIFRDIEKWDWFHNSKMVGCFIKLIMRANWADQRFEGQIIPRGSFVSSRRNLSEYLGISEQSLCTLLLRLKSTDEVTSKSTNRFTIYTIVNYNKWQDVENKVTSKSTDGSMNDQRTNNEQSTTIEEYKERKKKNTVLRTVRDAQFNIWFRQIENAYPPQGRLYSASARGQLKLLKPTEELITAILCGIENWKNSELWTKDNGQFVVNLTKFLSNRMWEKEVPSQAQNWKARAKTLIQEEEYDY